MKRNERGIHVGTLDFGTEIFVEERNERGIEVGTLDFAIENSCWGGKGGPGGIRYHLGGKVGTFRGMSWRSFLELHFDTSSLLSAKIVHQAGKA